MKVAELAEKLGAKVLNEGVDLEGEVKSAYVCDLLSWVMAKGAQGTAWITVMNHINVIAAGNPAGYGVRADSRKTSKCPKRCWIRRRRRSDPRAGQQQNLL